MTVHRYAAYAALLLLTQCSKCKDDPQPRNNEPQLPAETQTGANTFGMRLNGQVWRPAGTFGGPPSLTAEYFAGGYGLIINVNKRRVENGVTVEQYFHLAFDSLTQPGRYILNSANGRSITFHDDICEYETDVTHPAVVEITRLDGVARIVSGRFFFTLEQPGCPKVEVTEGRFDLKF